MADSCQPRPRLHITAPMNWLNDPNAPLYHRGTWHVFYQYNPDAPRWGLMRWGHTVSADLLDWTDAGPALRPGRDRADAAGAWSGSVRIIDGEPVFFYTGVRGEGDDHEQNVVRAVAADDDLSELRPAPAEPVLTIDHTALGTLHQRDPYLIRRGDRWLMILGSGLPENGGGAVTAWESDDTFTWHYRGIIFSLAPGGPIETGPTWECPQLMEVDGRWVLLISVQTREGDSVRCLHVTWFIGDLTGTTYTPEAMGILDHGDCFYATAVAEGTKSTLLWGWLQDAPATERSSDPEFVGALSLPRELYLDGGQVRTRPAPALDALWDEPTVRDAEIGLRPGGVFVVADQVPTTFRVRLRDVPVGLSLGLLNAGSEDGVWIGLDEGVKNPVGWLVCDAGTAPPRRFETELGPGGIDIEAIIDLDIVEVFIAGRAFSLRWGSRDLEGTRIVLRADQPGESGPAVEVAILARR